MKNAINKESQRIKLTKKLIKGAVLELLKTKNMQQMTVRELCDLAEINRSTFYKYYGSPYDVIYEIEEDIIDDIKDIYVDAESIIDFANCFEKTLIYIENNLELCKTLVNSNVTPDFPLDYSEYPFFQEVLGKFLPLCGEDKQSPYFQTFVINGGYSLLKMWINDDNRVTPSEMTKVLFEQAIEFLKLK